jgi:uncharacterized small protein (DUF1192 family)
MEQSVAHAQEKIVKLEAEIERLRAELKKEYERGFNDHAKFVSRITEIARMKD